MLMNNIKIGVVSYNLVLEMVIKKINPHHILFENQLRFVVQTWDKVWRLLRLVVFYNYL